MSHGSVTQPRQGDLWNSHDQHALAVLRPHESFIGDFEYEVVSKCEAVVLIGPKPFEDTRFRHPFDHLALNVVHHSLGRYFPRDFDETVLTGPQAEAARIVSHGPGTDGSPTGLVGVNIAAIHAHINEAVRRRR